MAEHIQNYPYHNSIFVFLNSVGSYLFVKEEGNLGEQASKET